LFLEEDVVLSPDFMQVLWYALQVKNLLAHDILQVALGGWSGENTVNAHPDTFVVRKSYCFQPMAYAFNVSFVRRLGSEKDFNNFANISDYCYVVTHLVLREREFQPWNIIVPTLSRMWHVGKLGLGAHGDSRKQRETVRKAPWELVPRLIDLTQVKVNDGVRDNYGFLCHPRQMLISQIILHICDETKYPQKMRFSLHCWQDIVMKDKCALTDFNISFTLNEFAHH